MTTPWYRDGLSFSCTRCGTCCTGAPGFVWVNAAEVQALADHLGMTVEQFRAVYTRPVGIRRTLREKGNGDCAFFDRDKGCTVYPVRPHQCRTWPFWESNVRSPDDWQRTCEACPGAGQGKLIPADEITRRLNVIRL